MKFSSPKNLLLIGNLATGKTSVGKRLSKQLSLPFFSIDEAREKVKEERRDGEKTPWALEYLAWHYAFAFLESQENWIFEFSGTGIHRHGIRHILEGKSHYLVVELFAPLEILHQRHKGRNPKKVFLSFESVEGYLTRVEKELRQLRNESFWNPRRYLRLSTHPFEIEKICEQILNHGREIL